MCDEEMKEVDKENVDPEPRISTYQKLAKRVINILPLNFNRKRRRSSDFDEPSFQDQKRNRVVLSRSGSCRQGTTFLQSIMSIPRFLTQSDRDQYEYLDYMNQRESFD